MNHRVVALAAFLLGVVGCLDPQTRLQSEDERDKEAEVKTIGDVTSIGNAEPIAVSGVGLVTGLDGTGGGTPPGGFRTMLEAELRKHGLEPKEILASSSNAMVLVSGVIPAGARKDDPIDVEVTLPAGSKVTSLRGGVLQQCLLSDYSSTRRLNPSSGGLDKLKLGHPLARAEGALLVGFGDGDEAAKVKQGRIWEGGKSLLTRPFYLVLNNDRQYSQLAMHIAERINQAFATASSGPGKGLAEAKTKEVVYLSVPEQYRYNVPRFLRVVRMMPLTETPAAGSPYRRRLAEELLDPARTVTTALRLEALGSESVPALKVGLKSDHVLVRFGSAEALAYLGDACGGDELARLTIEQPMLRSYCLTALASLDESVCYIKLRELLANVSPEIRYGAFRALRALRSQDKGERDIQGEHLNDSFWVHLVAPDAMSLVHMSTSRRAEIVLFGEEQLLEPPFSFLAGPEFTITASAEDERCTISRFSIGHGIKRRQCSLKLIEVLHTLADLGGTYPDAVELLRLADRAHCLSCAVAVDALPEATTVFQLAKAGLGEGERSASDPEILKARADFGATPTLFEVQATRRPPRAE